jgi:hypothetical protein
MAPLVDVWKGFMPREPSVSGKEAAINYRLRDKVDESLADPRPNKSIDEVFKRLRAYHAARDRVRRG